MKPAFLESAFGSYGAGPVFEPFYASPEQADEAHRPGISRYEFAYGPFPIDDEDLADFIVRWGGLLAKAAEGNLRKPQQLPVSEWIH